MQKYIEVVFDKRFGTYLFQQLFTNLKQNHKELIFLEGM